MSEKEIIFCKSGGCTAKLGAGVLEHILERLPKGKKDENLLIGYDSKDDAAVYRLNEHQAVVQRKKKERIPQKQVWMKWHRKQCEVFQICRFVR